MTGDRARVLAHATAAAALVGVPTLGPLLVGSAEDAEVLDTPVTPPDRTFAVWGPIFLTCLAGAVDQARPRRRTDPEHRATGWPLTAAYGLNAAWSVATQRDAWRATPVLLPAAAGAAFLAHRRLQHVGTAESLTSLGTGMLLGWTTLAATINLAAVPRLVGSTPSPAVSAAGVLAASGALADLVRRSRRGRLALAGTALWGLANAALDRRRPTVARAATGLGALVIGAATARPAPITRD